MELVIQKRGATSISTVCNSLHL